MRATSSCILGGSVFFIDSDIFTSDSYSRFRKGIHRLVNNPDKPGMAIITIDTDRNPEFDITADNLIGLLATSRLKEYRPMNFLVVNKSEQYLVTLTADNSIQQHNTAGVHPHTYFTTICHNDSQALVDKKLTKLSAGLSSIKTARKNLPNVSNLDLALADRAATPIVRKVPSTAVAIPSLGPAPSGDWHNTLLKLNVDRRALSPCDVWASDFSSSPRKPKKIIVSMAAISNTDMQGRDRWGEICHTFSDQAAICPRPPHRILTNALRSATGSKSLNREKDIIGFVDLTRPMYLPHTEKSIDATKFKPTKGAETRLVPAKVLNNAGNYYDVSYLDQPIANEPTLFRRQLIISGRTVGAPYIYSEVLKQHSLDVAVIAMNVFSNALLTGELNHIEECQHRFSLLVKTTEGMFLHRYKYKPDATYPILIGKPELVADDYFEDCDITVVADRFEREATKEAIGRICHNDISHISMLDADQMVANAISPFSAPRKEKDTVTLMGTPISLKSSTTASIHSGLKSEALSDDHDALSTQGHTGIPANIAVSDSGTDEDYTDPEADDASLSPAISAHLTPPYLRDTPSAAEILSPVVTAPPRRSRHGIALAAAPEESKDPAATPPLFVKRGHPPRPTAASRFSLFGMRRKQRTRVAPMPTSQAPKPM
ncbi:MAG: hypothetical protein P1U63_03620 [Coxiellaceae bacterium]|nr:hypothetical protein [Coxiellaceae bacterium]